MNTRRQGQIILTCAGLLFALVWLFIDRSLKPLIISIILITLLIVLFYSDKIVFNKNKAKKITLLIASFYCLFGNIIGYILAKSMISDGLLCYSFIPYTFIWGLSSLVGFDWLSFVFEIIAFLLSCAIFFPIGLYFANPSKKSNSKEKE
jgi:hypothetical protein